MRRRHSLAALALVAGLVLTACGSSSEDTGKAEAGPAAVTAIAGSEVKLVTLTQRAHERLGIKTAVTAERGKRATAVPYSAVIHDNTGRTWVYTPQDGKPLSFARRRVAIADVQADTARLTRGPGAGTPVVSTGAAMLWGTELGVGTE